MPRKKKELVNGEALVNVDTQGLHSLANKNGGRHSLSDNRKAHVSANGNGSHVSADTREKCTSVPDSPLQETISTLVELWRRRQAAHRAEKSLTLTIKSTCRRCCGGDKGEAEKLYRAVMGKGNHPDAAIVAVAVMSLKAARDVVETDRAELEKRLRKMAESLPGMDFINATPGLTEFTLAALIGECPGRNMRGFLDFDTPSRVWKFIGLATVNGERQRKTTDKALAAEMKYCPSRRSVSWTLAEPLFKMKGPYRELYDHYKIVEIQNANARGQEVVPSADIKSKEKNTVTQIGAIVIHARAKRRMEKAMVRDVWAAFRAEARGEKAPGIVFPDPLFRPAIQGDFVEEETGEEATL